MHCRYLYKFQNVVQAVRSVRSALKLWQVNLESFGLLHAVLTLTTVVIGDNVNAAG